jgi:hypothetical protein
MQQADNWARLAELHAIWGNQARVDEALDHYCDAIREAFKY